jgi:geranylgeranyl diphosphate synthase type II
VEIVVKSKILPTFTQFAGASRNSFSFSLSLNPKMNNRASSLYLRALRNLSLRFIVNSLYRFYAFIIFVFNSYTFFGDKKPLSISHSKAKFDFRQYMEERRLLVEEALDKSLTSESSNSQKIIESMRYSLLAGGKRVRPILVLAATELFGGNVEAALPTAVAVEMIHTMSLIHDDLPAMDNDVLRRGKPTNHVVYGEDIAILAGDALLSSSFEYVAKYTKKVPAERIVEVIRRLGTSVGPAGLAGGQAKDLECENKEGVTVEELQWIHMHKTAALLKVSVSAGAVLAGATPEEVACCEIYAEKIGLAFQIADDILDATASSNDLGKTAGKDESTNKTTYVKLLGLERSKQEALRVVDEAKAALAPFGDRAIPLKSIADFIVLRKN